MWSYDFMILKQILREWFCIKLFINMTLLKVYFYMNEQLTVHIILWYNIRTQDGAVVLWMSGQTNIKILD